MYCSAPTEPSQYLVLTRALSSEKHQGTGYVFIISCIRSQKYEGAVMLQNRMQIEKTLGVTL